MTLEEALKKIADGDALATIKKIISDQNSYITTLESQVKDLSNKQPSSINPATQQYLENSMRKDTIAEAKQIILQDISVDVFNAVEADWLEFLKTVKTSEFTKDYVVNAFELILGRCLRKKDHPVNKLGKDSNPQDVTPITQSPGTNSKTINDVQKLIQQQPPVDNTSFAPGMPNITNPVKNTRDAFGKLKDKFSPGNPFK